MLRSKVVLVLACAVLVACTQELTRRERLVQRDLVEERMDTWVRLLNNAKQDSLALMYIQSPELQVMWPEGHRSSGWDQEEQALRDFYANIQYMNFVVSDRTIQVLTPEIAVSTFAHSTDIVQLNAQRRPVATGLGTIVWVKDPEDNLWKIYTEQIARNAPSRN
ncbi:MAG: hypothetical protein GTN62_13195 [Gemmatimonadales bacterium]|nr:hypothetical protein [Gemmatimonadales bacterium]NIN12865.1 hypothetical protein [Gemmatimonadales bacterium]NIN51043.1 hypothetical protein [Gemmatimonadales bacterium]NIP08507.1 hypothetical protein [Gemmatimonadales bacterium]NIR02547.1 hypothetical protein [Gemmatimonadales bacterium]